MSQDDDILAIAREGFLDEARDMLRQFEQALFSQAAGNERRHNLGCKLCIGQPGHRGDLVSREARPFARHIKPAIGCQTGERGAGKIERRGAPSCGDVVHERGG